MNQPTTPNTDDTFLPLPESASLTIRELQHTAVYTADQVRAAILADRAQRSPTVAGSVDTPEFREMLRKCAETWDTYEWDVHVKDLIAHINARLAPAAPSGEAVGEVGSMPGTEGFTMACFKASDVPIGTKLYTHPVPSEIEAAVELPPKPEPWIFNASAPLGSRFYFADDQLTSYATEAVLKDRARRSV